MKPFRRLPPWIRSQIPPASAMAEIRSRTYDQGLATVCKEARCPNQGTCARRGTATFLILGDRCTRDCAFCAVRHGVPSAVREDEPWQVGTSAAAMGLKHVVVTSVTRDDLPDGGAGQFARTVEAIHERSPGTSVEVLIPDFQGSEEALRAVIRARPEVINHNLETVSRLYPALRRGACYRRSLELLERVREMAPPLVTKSGIMVGVGETRQEVEDLIRDLVNAGCSILTIGQYLQPSRVHYPVHRFVPPEEFEELERVGRELGLRHVVSGPLVRSSYLAADVAELFSLSPLARNSSQPPSGG